MVLSFGRYGAMAHAVLPQERVENDFIAQSDTGNWSQPRRRLIVALSCAVMVPAFSPAIIRAESPERLLNLSIAELGSVKIDTVFGASKVTEKLSDAPSSVTLVTREEISRFGYRTLADILRSARSFDVTYDRNYSYAGVRGFTSLGDYGSRTLLLVDGHRMNEPIFDTVSVGTDGFLDVDLIERVELIRGAGSAIYGSNAFFGVINVITRSGASVNGVEGSVSGGSQESYSGRITLGKKLSNGVEYLLSATTYASEGQSRLFYREFNSPATNRGFALNQDGDRYWSMLGKLSYGDFTLQSGYVTRNKDIPTGSFGSVFNLPNSTTDSRGYVELRYAHETAAGWALAGRVHYDLYDYRGGALYDYDTGRAHNDDSARAHWWGAEATASRTFFNSFRFSLGTEFRKSTELRQRNYDTSPFVSYLDANGEQLVFGTYADGRWEISKSLSLSAGVRGDYYNTFGSTVNPRASLVWKPREGSTLKLLYGEAFRAPNSYQLDYTGPGQRANPSLQPETIRSYEAVAEQSFGTHWHGNVSLFRNEIAGLIDTEEDGRGDFIFANSGDARVNGVEAEIEGKWDNGILVRASYTRQDAVSGLTGERLANSPKNVFKAHVSAPLYRDKLFGSVELLYASDRVTLGNQRTGDAWLLNATLYSQEIAPGLELSASIYNVLDRKFSTPGGVEHLQDSIQQDGRSFRVKVTHRF
jgi:iron complex outermembrane receptor protein